jgi:hypothetical protein
MVDNGRLRFGGGGQESSTVPNPRDSVTGTGMFAQPFYWDEVRQRWYKLTFSDYPLDIAVGAGAGNRKANDSAGHWTGATVRDSQRSPSAFSPATTDTSDFTLVSTYENGVRRGYGTIIASNRVTIPSGEVLDLQHRYELGAEASFVKITTTISNRTQLPRPTCTCGSGHAMTTSGPTTRRTSTRGHRRRRVHELTDRTSPASALLITSGNAGMSRRRRVCSSTRRLAAPIWPTRAVAASATAPTSTRPRSAPDSLTGTVPTRSTCRSVTCLPVDRGPSSGTTPPEPSPTSRTSSAPSRRRQHLR